MTSIRIERAQNGFVVCIDDPEIVAKNKKSTGTYLNPERQFVFDDEAGVVAFITKNLDKVISPKKDEYETSFDVAAKEGDGEDEEEEDEDE
jgi:hypothetical protein